MIKYFKKIKYFFLAEKSIKQYEHNLEQKKEIISKLNRIVEENQENLVEIKRLSLDFSSVIEKESEIELQNIIIKNNSKIKEEIKTLLSES